MTIVLTILLTALLAYNIMMYLKHHRKHISFQDTFSNTSLPIIPIQINGHTCNMIVDSGSTTSYLDLGLAHNLKMHMTKINIQTVYMNGRRSSSKMTDTNFECAGDKMHGVFLLNNLQNTFKTIAQDTGVEVHGILGSDFMEQHGWVVDYGAKRICWPWKK